MSAVFCLPACLRVSDAASCGQAPHGNASIWILSETFLSNHPDLLPGLYFSFFAYRPFDFQRALVLKAPHFQGGNVRAHMTCNHKFRPLC